jgi:phosphatidate cytidylyltransferase
VAPEAERAETAKRDAAPSRVSEDAPTPEWRRPTTVEQLEAQRQKKADRAARRQKMKQAALDKTPKKLKNPSDIQVRFRTGLVYTVLTVVCVLAGDIPMLLMLMAVAGICAGEFYYMLRSDAKLPNEMLGIVAAMLYPPSVYFYGLTGAFVVNLMLLLALLVWYVFWTRARIPDVGISFFGAAYTGLLLCGLVVIRQSLGDPWGGVLVLLVFVSVWANDSFAYLIGCKFGRHKLAPRTSPKKSWEGFLAGLVGSMVFWCVMTLVPGVTMGIPMALLFGLICGLMSVLGDLAESRIKRNSGFKDSGTIMPGHGGLLDRCDSLFLAAVTSAILLVAGGCIPYVIM